MVALRRQIHANPEMACEEFATAELVAERMQRYAMASGDTCIIHARGTGGHGAATRDGWTSAQAFKRAARNASPAVQTEAASKTTSLIRNWPIGPDRYGKP